MRRRTTIAAALVAAGFLGGAPAQQQGPVLADSVYPALLQDSVQVAQAALAGEPNLRSAGRARVALVMLAEFAQQNLDGADGARRATNRDAALEIALLIQNKQYAEARQRLDRLAAVTANPRAKKERVALLGKHFELDELMSQFRAAKSGGLGIEEELDRLAGEANERVADAALNEKLRKLAYRTAVAGQLAQGHVPDKQAQDWKFQAEEMQRAALALAQAVEAKDGKTALAALTRLQGSCKRCHKIFR